MSELLVNTIKKADGTGSITVPANTGTLVDTSGADFTGDVTTTANVGAGTASPAAKLDVHNSSFGGSATTLHLSSTNSASEVIPYAGLGYVVDQGSDGIEAGSLTLSTYSSSALTERMRIDSSGNVMIGTTSADSSVLNVERDTHSVYGLKVEQTAGTVNFTINELIRVAIQSANAETPLQRFVAGGSTFGLIRINSTNNGTQYLTTSDYRLKENVVDMTDSVNRLKRLKPVNFNFIGNDVLAEGFLAHEVQEVVPTAVAGSKDAVDEDGNINPQMIEMQSMVPLLTGALQEAIAKIETLETTVADLQTRVTALENA